MPRDSNGSYSLPVGYLAVTGEPILAGQHNPPLEDLAAAMTSSLPRTGVAPMTGALKAYDGSVSAPGISFNTETGTGFYKTSSGFGVAVAGVRVAEFGSAGLVYGGPPIGSGMDFWGTTAPTGWLFPYGQAVSRTTYASLFAALGTTYGAGDGSTTFNLPDKRDRASFGKGDMGGTAANRITNQSGGWEGDTLGATGGEQTHAITEAELAIHSHGAALNSAPTTTIDWYTDTNLLPNSTANGAKVFSPTGTGGNTSIAATAPSITIGNKGSGQAHNNLPPGIVCNYIIFTGVF